MRLLLALPALLVLSACSEQQMCISRATQDLRAVRGFASEAEGNLSRGYALVKTQVVDYETVSCGTRPDGKTKRCRVPVRDTVFKHKAIDLDAEAAKLSVLRKKEAELALKADASVLACQKAYPS
jgi:hypothetical protein